MYRLGMRERKHTYAWWSRPSMGEYFKNVHVPSGNIKACSKPLESNMLSCSNLTNTYEGGKMPSFRLMIFRFVP